MDEFQVIKKIFQPLATKKQSSLNLDDDAAIISIKNKSIVIATDTIVEGDHFPKNEKNPTNIAKKLLRVNLSDIASMGANPFGYTVNLAVPKKLKKKDLFFFYLFYLLIYLQFPRRLWKLFIKKKYLDLQNHLWFMKISILIGIVALKIYNIDEIIFPLGVDKSIFSFR